MVAVPPCALDRAVHAADLSRHANQLAHVSFHPVIKSPERFAAFDADERASASRRLTYETAVDIFIALWDEARLLNPAAGEDWEHDVAIDIELARAFRRSAHARP